MKQFTVTFGETAKVTRFNESGTLGADPASFIMSARAEQIMREQNLSFGESLKRARREFFDSRPKVKVAASFSETDAKAKRRPDFDNEWVEIEVEESETARGEEE